jgi:hypothetical protein
MLIVGETDEIIIDLSDGKNIHVTEFNGSYFELYFRCISRKISHITYKSITRMVDKRSLD